MSSSDGFVYFFGCVIPNRYPGIEYAVRWVTGKDGFNLDVKDQKDFSCCPVPGRRLRPFPALRRVTESRPSTCSAPRTSKPRFA